MTHIPSGTAPNFDGPGVSVTGLAAPSRGARETSVWRLRIPPGTPGTPHAMDREEVFVVLAGRATAVVDGQTFALAAGDALIVPPDTTFSIANHADEDFEAVAALPLGGLAKLEEGEPFPPPWTI